jgi:hypothetical protein
MVGGIMMAVQIQQADPHLLEIAIHAVLHRNKEKLTLLSSERDDSVLLQQIAHEITLKTNAFQRITNNVLRDMHTKPEMYSKVLP